MTRIASIAIPLITEPPGVCVTCIALPLHSQSNAHSEKGTHVLKLSEQQRQIINAFVGVSQTAFLAAHERRTTSIDPLNKSAKAEPPKLPLRWGDVGAPEPKYTAKAPYYDTAMRSIQALEDGDNENAESVDSLVESACDHLVARDSEGDSMDPDERLVRAAKCLLGAIEAGRNPGSPFARVAYSRLRFE